jgi:UDP-N-acetylmuramoyl-tripeptide--D-alanyl-D-alanine ligase
MFSIEDLLLGNQGHISIVGTAELMPGFLFRSAQYDSSRCGAGDLYAATQEGGIDGHRFIPDAAHAGAAGALCTTPHPQAPAGFPQFVVPNVVKALQAAARIRVLRQRKTIKICITGSSGKTTTKEAIATVLSNVAPTLKTYANYNDEIEYPLTLLRLEAEQRYAVLEMGAEWVGELRGHCEAVIPPDWSVITAVGAAHLKHFGSRENVAIAKSELVQVLSEEGLAILNYDDPLVRVMKEQTRAPVIYYGRDPQADVRATLLEEHGIFGTHFTLHIEKEKIQVKLALPGMHGVTTALAAAAVGYRAGVPLTTIRDALETLTPVKGRGEVKPGAGPNGSLLIDDTYNSNRQAIIAITQALRATPISTVGKRWVILGELLELGEYAQEEHYASGKALSGTCDYLVAIGDDARYFVAGAQEMGMVAEQTYYFPANPALRGEVEEAKHMATELLKQKVTSEDMVLIKGSRGMRMESMLSSL